MREHRADMAWLLSEHGEERYSKPNGTCEASGSQVDACEQDKENSHDKQATQRVGRDANLVLTGHEPGGSREPGGSALYSAPRDEWERGTRQSGATYAAPDAESAGAVKQAISGISNTAECLCRDLPALLLRSALRRSALLRS